MAAPLDPIQTPPFPEPSDTEARALQTVHRALSGLDRNAQKRVLDWATDRFLKTQEHPIHGVGMSIR